MSPTRPSSSPRVSLGTRQLVTFLRARSAKKGYCYWRQEKIAEVMERGLRTVNRQVAEAIGAGLIRSERHGHVNVYTPCDLIGKVAYREAAVQKPAHSAAAGASDTPNWRIEPPPVSITEILKPEKNHQSESTVHEHREPAVAETEPSPFEKAQTEAIADAVRWCGFEPTPDLTAKLDRKRRHYGVTGFVVASAIARAFKLVQGTSSHPQGPGWILAVVENALAASKRPAGVERRDAAGEMPATYRPKWTPAPGTPAIQNQTGPITEPVAVVDQADVAGVAINRAAEPERGEEAQHGQPAPTSPPAEVCARCGSDGVINGTAPASWCDCERGRQKQRARPEYVDVLNRSGWRSRVIAAAAQPRPVQGESGAFAAGGQRSKNGLKRPYFSEVRNAS